MSSRSFRGMVLTGASALALAGAAVGITSSMAKADNSYSLALGLYLSGNGPVSPPTVTQTDFNIAANINQTLGIFPAADVNNPNVVFANFPAVLSAVVLDTGVVLEWDAGDFTIGLQSGSNLDLTGDANDNSIFATAQGNFVTSDSSGVVFDLADLYNGGTGDDGVGIVTSPVQAIIGALDGEGDADFAENAYIEAEALNVTTADSTLNATGNDITATATVNQSTPVYTAKGTLPLDYVSTTSSSTDASFDTLGNLEVTTNASVAIATVQTAIDSGSFGEAGEGSQAAIYGGEITLSDTLDANGVDTSGIDYTDVGVNLQLVGEIDSTLTLSGNSQTAAFTGNLAQTVVEADAASGGEGINLFQGSVNVTTAQANFDTSSNNERPFAAVVQESSIVATLAGEKDLTISVLDEEDDPVDVDYDIVAQLNGVLTVDDNSIEASATGNSAINVIAFDDGISVIAPSNGETDANTLGYPVVLSGGFDVNQISAEVGAGLVIANLQANVGSTLSSVSQQNTIGAAIEVVGEDAVVAVDDNSIAATAIGSASLNQIIAEGTIIDSTVAVANLQTNNDFEGEFEAEPYTRSTLILATNYDSEISADLGYVAVDGEFGIDQTFTQSGTVDVSGNAITATAKGNVSGSSSLSTPTIALTATVLTADNEAGIGSASNEVDDFVIAGLDGEAGITATNLQSNFGSEGEIVAQVFDAKIGIDLSYTLIDEEEFDSYLYPLSLLDGTYTVDDNTIAATARGNEAYTQVLLTGTVGGNEASALTAVVASGQNNESFVEAVNAGATIIVSNLGLDVYNAFRSEITGSGDVIGSTVTVDGNTISASATGNKVSNLLAAYDFTDLTLAADMPDLFDEAGETGLEPGNPSIVTNLLVDDADLVPNGFADGNFVVFNSQLNQGDVTAILGGLEAFPATIGTYLYGNVDGSVLDVSGNAATAAATGNEAVNQLLVDSVVASASDFTKVASLSNMQANAGAITTGALGAIGISVEGDNTELDIGNVIGSTLTVTDNVISASGTGNVASNTLEATSTAYGFNGIVEDSYTAGARNDATSQAFVAAEFALQSVQTNSAAIDVAAAGIVGVQLSSDTDIEPRLVEDSTLDISDNSIVALARQNAASNAILLGEGSSNLNSSAALQNLQIAGGVNGVEVDTVGSSAGQIGLDAFTDGGEFLVIHSDIVVDGNSIVTNAFSNFAQNSITIDTTNLAGSSTSTGSGAGLDNALSEAYSAIGDYSVANGQYRFGDVQANNIEIEIEDPEDITDLLGSVSLIGVAIDGIVDGGSITVTDNSIEGLGVGNYAANVLDLKATNGDDLSASLSSAQFSQGDTWAAAAGLIAVTFDSVVEQELNTGVAISVGGNEIAARSYANDAVNSLSFTGTTLEGENSNSDTTAYYQDGYVNYVEVDDVWVPDGDTSTLGAAYAAADFSLFNTQVSTDITAAEAYGAIGVLIEDNVPAQAPETTQTVLSVTDNDIVATAIANRANNSLDLTASSTLDASAALTNLQNGSGGAYANTAGAIGILVGNTGEGDIGATPISVTGNSIQSTAIVNSANNSLDVTGGTVAATQTEVQNATAFSYLTPEDYTDSTGDPASALINTLGATGDFSLLNGQISSGAPVQASVDAFAIGTLAFGDISPYYLPPVGEPEVAGPSSASVTGNSVGATAQANSASNTLTVTGTTVNAKAGLTNGQLNLFSAPVSAEVGFGVIGVTADTIDTAPINVSGNSVVASAGGNAASNVLNASPSSAFGPTSGGAYTNANGAEAYAEADYAVLNIQANYAPISAGVSNVLVGSAASTMVSASATVSGNQVAAQAIGNSASNSIVLAGLPGSNASAALTSSQVNAATISSQISGVTIGITTGVGSNGVASVGGNSIGATAIGNSAVNSIKSSSGL